MDGWLWFFFFSLLDNHLSRFVLITLPTTLHLSPLLWLPVATYLKFHASLIKPMNHTYSSFSRPNYHGDRWSPPQTPQNARTTSWWRQPTTTTSQCIHSKVTDQAHIVQPSFCYAWSHQCQFWREAEGHHQLGEWFKHQI